MSESGKTVYATLSIFFILLMLPLKTSAQSNENLHEGFFSLNFSAGYSAFSMKEAKEVLTKAKDFYAVNNINIPNQKLYPAGIITEFSGLFNAGKGFHTGLGIQFGSTSAVSSYKDIYGSLELKGTSGFVTMNWLTRKYFPAYSSIRPFAEAALGIAFARYRLNSDLKYNELREYDISKSASGNTIGPSLQASAGAEYWLKGFIKIYFKAGYNYIRSGKGSSEAEFPGLKWVSIVSPVKIPASDFSGLNGGAGVSFQF
ncbi:MAG: hypothetical protein ACM3P0_10175 [Acidobacteriota bacterium]